MCIATNLGIKVAIKLLQLLHFCAWIFRNCQSYAPLHFKYGMFKIIGIDDTILNTKGLKGLKIYPQDIRTLKRGDFLVLVKGVVETIIVLWYFS